MNDETYVALIAQRSAAWDAWAADINHPDAEVRRLHFLDLDGLVREERDRRARAAGGDAVTFAEDLAAARRSGDNVRVAEVRLAQLRHRERRFVADAADAERILVAFTFAQEMADGAPINEVVEQ